MKKHPFRVAIESGASKEDLAKLFSHDAVLLAPMLSKPVSGVSQVLAVIGHAARVAGPIHYTRGAICYDPAGLLGVGTEAGR
jgi:hypothetical protein